MSDTGPAKLSAFSFNNHPGMLSGLLALHGFNFDNFLRADSQENNKGVFGVVTESSARVFFVVVCFLLFIYLFKQVEVLAAIQLTWTCYTHPTIYTQRTATIPGTSSPTLLELCVGSLTSYRELMNMEVICETGPPAYRPYPRRLESLNICGCNYKGSTFSSVI